MAITRISVRGARQHNLKNIRRRDPAEHLDGDNGFERLGEIPLAFDTIYAEGQRSMSKPCRLTHASFWTHGAPRRRFIDGLSPAISIEQKTTNRSPRSTVGTITEIYDYLRLLYSSIGVPHCPTCGKPITRQSAEQSCSA